MFKILQIRGSGKHCRHSPGCGRSPLHPPLPCGAVEPKVSSETPSDMGTGSIGVALQSHRAGQQLGTPRRSRDMWARPCSVPLQLVADAGGSIVALCPAQAAAPPGTPEGSTSRRVPNEERNQEGVLKCHPPAAHPPRGPRPSQVLFMPPFPATCPTGPVTNLHSCSKNMPLKFLGLLSPCPSCVPTLCPSCFVQAPTTPPSHRPSSK